MPGAPWRHPAQVVSQQIDIGAQFTVTPLDLLGFSVSMLAHCPRGEIMARKLCAFRITEEQRHQLDTMVTGRSTTVQNYLTDLIDADLKRHSRTELFATNPCSVVKSPRLSFSFIDLFAGIGGFRIGLTRAGGRCLMTCEYDKYSQRTYKAWFGADEPFIGDINSVVSRDVDLRAFIPEHDVLAAGFPCQPFSIAGVSKKNSLGRAHGFDDERQGNLFFKICKIVDARRPPVLFLENVKNLQSHDGGNTWATIYRTLTEELNYKVFAKVIDARSWVPQHRERIFIVCFDKQVFPADMTFEFPTPPETEPVLGDILEKNPDPKYTLTPNLWAYLQEYAKKHKAKGNGFGFGLVGPQDVARTMSARYYKDGSEILIRQIGSGRPRRLTHREASQLMGFTDECARTFGHENGFPVVVSDMQAYKQFGNAVVPAVVEAIAVRIVEKMQWLIDERGNRCLLKGRFEQAPKRKAQATA